MPCGRKRAAAATCVWPARAARSIGPTHGGKRRCITPTTPPPPSRNTRSRSYQCTVQPVAPAAVARASRYSRTESATVWRAIVGDPLLGCRRKLRAHTDRDAHNRHGHRRGQRLQARPRARERRRRAPARPAPRPRQAKSTAPTGCSGNGPPPMTPRGDADASADRARLRAMLLRSRISPPVATVTSTAEYRARRPDGRGSLRSSPLATFSFLPQCYSIRRLIPTTTFHLCRGSVCFAFQVVGVALEQPRRIRHRALRRGNTEHFRSRNFRRRWTDQQHAGYCQRQMSPRGDCSGQLMTSQAVPREPVNSLELPASAMEIGNQSTVTTRTA